MVLIFININLLRCDYYSIVQPNNAYEVGIKGIWVKRWERWERDMFLLTSIFRYKQSILLKNWSKPTNVMKP